MSLYSLCSYFPVLCCCGCRNSIFFQGAKIQTFSESAKTKSYTGGRNSMFSRGIRHEIPPHPLTTEYLQVWLFDTMDTDGRPKLDRNSTETGTELAACCHGVGYYLHAGVRASRQEDANRRCG